MKLKLLNSLILCLIFFISCQSQVEVFKEFDQNEYICSYHQFDGVDLYATFDTDNNEIKIYNSNHHLQSSLIYDAGNYYNMIQIYGISKDVFNADSNIEFLIQKIQPDGNAPSMVLLNDKNTVLQEFKGFSGFRTIGNKMYIIDSTSETFFDQISQLTQMKKTDKLYSINGKFRKIIY